MQKHKLWWLSTTVILVVSVGLSVLGVLLKHKPFFYRNGQIHDSAARKVLDHECLSQFGQLMVNFKTRQEIWGCTVTEPQMNCFLEESFARSGEAEKLREIGVSDLNVLFRDQNHLRVAFRYGSGWFSTVISYDLHIWPVPKEPNVIAVQILRARAGALPISSQSVLHQLSEFARHQNYKVMLYRHEHCPVAVIELQPYQPHPEGVLTGLVINQGKLSIQGMTLEHALAPPLIKINTPMSQ